MNRVLLVYLFLIHVIACDARNLESDGRKRSESNVNIRIQGDNLHGENLLVQYIESRIELKKKELAQTDVNNFDYEHIQKELKIYQEDLERLKKETQLWDNYSNAKKVVIERGLQKLIVSWRYSSQHRTKSTRDNPY
jgi:hypothetical protein